MKKLLLASAFALFGTFAMANEVEIEEVERECSLFKSQTECGGYYTACKEKGEAWDTEKLNAGDRAMCDKLKELVDSIPEEL